MIKLFGWESRIKNEIGQKRKSELDVVWRARKFEYNIDFFKWVIFAFLPALELISSVQPHPSVTSYYRDLHNLYAYYEETTKRCS